MKIYLKRKSRKTAAKSCCSINKSQLLMQIKFEWKVRQYIEKYFLWTVDYKLGLVQVPNGSILAWDKNKFN